MLLYLCEHQKHHDSRQVTFNSETKKSLNYPLSSRPFRLPSPAQLQRQARSRPEVGFSLAFDSGLRRLEPSPKSRLTKLLESRNL